MRGLRLVAFLTCLVCWPFEIGSAATPEMTSPEAPSYFVSPTGNDSWSGTLPEVNASHSDGPFRTIERVQQSAREAVAKGGLKAPVRVILRQGTYFLSAPLVFRPEDSGVPESDSALNAKPGQPVIYAAYTGEKPIVSGGRRITGWREERLRGKPVWTTILPEVAQGKWYFRQLFVNGSRRMRPRLPKEGFYRIAQPVDAKFEGDPDETWQRGSDRFIYSGADLRSSWHNLQDVEITVLTLWYSLHLKIKSLDEPTHLAVLDRNSSLRMTDDFEERGAQYYVENVFEALEEPGQWYLDRPTGKLYYLPRPGETPEATEVIAPYLSALVRIEGASLDERVQALEFRGLTFAHTEWQLPPDKAIPGIQAANDLPGAVILRNARLASFDACTFEHLGNYAVELAEGCSDVRIVGCDMRDLGGGGVKIWDGCKQNLVSDCEIGHGGLLYHASVPVLIGRSSGNQVIHNHLHHFYYSGVSVGWNWGYGEGDAYGNVIEHNHIHDLGQGMLSDMGGIYTLGPSHGTRIRYNLIHDIRRRGYGDQGIYLDEGSSGILIEGNIVYGCQNGFSESGRDNVFRNNIFALNREYQMRPYTMAGSPPRAAFVFERNIVYYNQGDLIYTESEGENWVWSPENARFRQNLYFNASGAPLKFRDQTFEEWQERGFDAGSVVADPLFVDAKHGDFRLRPGSPAVALGFQPPDLSTVGPRRDSKGLMD